MKNLLKELPYASTKKLCEKGYTIFQSSPIEAMYTLTKYELILGYSPNLHQLADYALEYDRKANSYA